MLGGGEGAGSVEGVYMGGYQGNSIVVHDGGIEMLK
jgi:hypothetical protein